METAPYLHWKWELHPKASALPINSTRLVQQHTNSCKTLYKDFQPLTNIEFTAPVLTALTKKQKQKNKKQKKRGGGGGGEGGKK